MEIDGAHTQSRAAAAGFGRPGEPDFWIGGEGGLKKPLHVAIVAADRASVDAFHVAALHAGGRDNGAPGLRPHYHANYYAAFVFDPDGHNIEAVCHPVRCAARLTGQRHNPDESDNDHEEEQERRDERKRGATLPPG